jgi:tRNA modification GTPase
MGLHLRQKRCLLAAAQAAERAAAMLAGAVEVADLAEVAALDLRDALGQLGQISGQVVTEDILGRIFSRFCVGK